MRVLVTGGAGFIGSNFLCHMVPSHPSYHFVNLDVLSYAGNLENLRPVERASNYQFVKGNICDRPLVESLFNESVDAVVNFAAESHVDRSIADPGIFAQTNIMGTQVLLDVAREHRVQKFVQVSTDEVYGSIGGCGLFTEESPLAPNSPYSASKAGADLLVRAYHHTFGMPVNITRCSNNYGAYQFPEKLIPLMITNGMEDRELPVYGDGLHIRDWLHVSDHVRAIDRVLHDGVPGEIYNIGGNNEKTNLAIVSTILEALGNSRSPIRFVKDRPGHDRRYAIDASKIQRELGWQPMYNFERGIQETIAWYQENRPWCARVKSGQYREYSSGPNGVR